MSLWPIKRPCPGDKISNRSAGSASALVKRELAEALDLRPDVWLEDLLDRPRLWVDQSAAPIKSPPNRSTTARAGEATPRDRMARNGEHKRK